MKSSTLNQPNIQALKSDRRLEALVKQEMRENQHLISSHSKEMQALRDSTSLSMEQCKSLSGRNEQELKEFKEYALSLICHIKDRMIANDYIISEQRKTIEDLHQQLLNFQVAYSSKNDTEKVRKDLSIQIEVNTVSHINSFQEFQREFKILLNSIKDDLNKLISDMEQQFVQVNHKANVNFSISRLDREAVVKEIRVYEKTIFIIEKKLENIYTLIERINQRGELCHKPE